MADECKEITRDHFLKYLRYEPETGKLFWKAHVKPGNTGGVLGAEAGSVKFWGYRRINLARKSYSAHRVIWLIHYGAWPKGQLDHINGVRDDNRIENLRESNARENCHNRDIHRAGRLFGTTHNKKRNAWIAQIKTSDTNRYLGQFRSEEEAHTMYLMALDFYGDMLKDVRRG